MANYREPQWLLPNEKNLAMPASDATVGSGLAEDRQSLYSMDFDGTDYISAPNTFLNSASVCTLSFWMKGTGEVGGGYAWNGLQLDVGGGSANFRTMNGSNVNNYVSFSPGTDWHHYLGVYVGGGYSKLYIDGVLKQTLSSGIPATLASNSGDVFKIGYGFSYSVAEIDEVAIWTKALSDGNVADGATATGEIATIYNSGAPGNLMALGNKPIAYYPLGEQARLGSEWQFPNEVLQSQVFDFNGTSEVIDINSTIDLGTVHTISFWVNVSATSFANIISGTGGSKILFNSPNKIYYYSEDFTNSQPSVSTPLNQWNNVVIARNGGTIKFYVNNSLLHTVSGFGGTNFTFNKILGLDVNNKLSNLAVWDTDQSANIANIYNNGSPQSSYTTTPTAWYKLNATSNYAGLNPNFHNALDFGATDYIDCGDGLGDSLGSYTGVITASTWVNPTLMSAGYGVFQIGDTGNGKFTLAFTSNNLYVYTAASSTATAQINGLSALIGKWNHIAIVWDTQDATNSKIYINGVATALSSGSFDTGTAALTGEATRLGYWYSTGYTFLGKISNTAFFNQAISAEDVLYLYNGGTPQTSLSFEPVSWYKLDNLAAGIEDSGSASNDGTNNGATEVTDSVAVDQWNFDNVSHAQTPTYTKCLQTTTTADRVLTGGITAPSMDYIYLSTWYRSTDTLEKILFSNNLAKLYVGTTRVYITTHHGAVYRSFPVQVMDGNWHHIIYGFPNTGGSVTLTDMKVWVDGKEIAGANAGGSSMTGNVTSINGLYTGTGQNPASVSNYSFFNTDISSNIATMYNNGTPGDISSLNPYLWYKLNNTASSSSSDGLYDNGSGGNNGTLSGTWNNINTNVLTSRLNGESTTLPSTALVSSDLQFESPYSNFSLDFDGTNDSVNCIHDSVLDITGSITLSCWMKSSNTGANRKLLTKDDVSTRSFQMNTNHASLGPYTYFWLGGGVLKSVSTGTPDQIVDGNWHHVVSVFKSGEYIRMYIDGVQAGNTNVTETTLDSSTANFLIGSNGWSGTVGIDGNVDEVAIWNSALTQAQISQVYNNGYPADLTSLSPVSWWRLGEDAYFVSPNFTVPNQITGAPNGTSQNMDQADLVADAPGSYASGIGSSLALADRVGDAPESTANSLSFNMTPLNKISYPAGYVPTQVDNVYSMAFDGVSDYVNCGVDLSSYTDMTVSTWVKWNSFSGTYHYVFSAGTAAGGGRVFGIAKWENSGADANKLYTFDGATSTKTSQVISLSTWYNIVVTQSGTTKKVYVNGVEISSFTASALDLNNINYLGKYSYADSYYAPVNIDETAIFDYALSARQIKQDIYNGTTTGKTADLNNISNLTAPVAWYRMGD